MEHNYSRYGPSEEPERSLKPLGACLLGVVSGLWGVTFFTAYLPLQALAPLDTAPGRFFFYFLPFLMSHAVSRALFDWKSVCGSTGKVLELGAAYVSVSFHFQLMVLITWLPLQMPWAEGGYVCGNAYATWMNMAASFPLVLGKGMALLDRWREMNRRSTGDV